MPNFTVESAGSKTYLVYQINDASRDTMTQGMITNNRIPGLLPAVFSQADSDKFVKYDISSRIPVKQVLSGTVSRRQIMGILKGITDAMISVEDYMIAPESLVFDISAIYVDVSTFNAQMICLPILSDARTPVDLLQFFKNILYTSKYAENEDGSYVPKLISYLNGLNRFNASDFSVFLKTMDESIASTGFANAPSMGQPIQPHMASSIPQAGPIQNSYNPQMPSQAYQGQIPPAYQGQSTVQFTGANYNAAPQNNVASSQPVLNSSLKQAPRSPQSPQQGPAKPAAVPPRVPSAGTGMPVPPMRTPNAPAQVAQQPAADDGQEMSWFYLMQHYNKENAAIYKAQKERKKAAKAASSPDKPKKQKNGKRQKEVKQAADYRVPGAPGTPQAANPMGVSPTAGAYVQQNSQPVYPQQQPQAGYMNQGGMPQANVQQFQQPFVPQSQGSPAVSSPNFGETTVLKPMISEETTVLNPSMLNHSEKRAYLVRQRTNERIPVTGSPFRIGKERSFVDYFISDNAAISRTHASIETRDGKYFITDSNSTNHTYVNGQMIPGSTPTEIQSGAKLRLADEEFEFVVH